MQPVSRWQAVLIGLLLSCLAGRVDAAARFTNSVPVNGKIVIGWTSRGVLETASQLAGPWTTVTNASNPYTNSITTDARFFRLNQRVDASTLHKKVLCGYQGWFRSGGDGGNEWDHWNRDWFVPPATNRLDWITFEMWPDVSEYTNQYPVTGFTLPGGAQAYLYSAQDQQTVDKHFDWMQDYGIDGVVVQRFVTQTPPDSIQTWKTNVLNHVRAAAARTGRTFFLEYDMSGATNDMTLFTRMTNDWVHLVDDLNLTQDPRYQYHDDRPVLMIFGFYPERFPNDLTVPKQIIAWFKTNATYGVTLIGSGWWNWRAGAHR